MAIQSAATTTPGLTEDEGHLGPTSLEEARVDLAAAHRLAVMDDFHEGSWNHLSLAVPGRPSEVLITPANRHWSLVTASSLQLVDTDAEAAIAQGGGAAWVAYRIHYPIHRLRPAAACVLHLHTRNIVAFAALEAARLEVSEQDALNVASRVAYTEEYDGLWPADLRHGERLAEALGDKSILIMRGHGVIVTGPTVGAAYTDLYLLDRACGTQLRAWSTGRKLMRIPDDGTHTISRRVAHLHFEAMKEVLDRNEPDFRD